MYHKSQLMIIAEGSTLLDSMNICFDIAAQHLEEYLQTGDKRALHNFQYYDEQGQVLFGEIEKRYANKNDWRQSNDV